MDQSKIVIRRAEPTYDEGLAFARYLDQAAEGFFRFLLGHESHEIIAKTFPWSGHDFSFENVFFAQLDGNIAGMAAGYTAEQRRHFMKQPLKEAAGGFSFRQSLLITLLAPFWRVLETLDEGDFYVLSVAVDQHHHRKGIGSFLMDHMEDMARGGNASRFVLDVAASNQGAQQLYRRRGMVKSSVWPKVPFFPAILIRMTKPLHSKD